MKISELYLLPVRRCEMKKVLRKAMLDFTPEELSWTATAAGITGALSGYLLQKYAVHSSFPFFVPFVFSILFYSSALIYPYAAAKSRKTAIDLKLPHAITYMRSLCGAMPLYEVFRQIFSEKDLYGEVSEEFGFIVRDVELFGENLVKAMTNLMDSTPSESLKEFLEGLIMVFESGGDMKDYMASKTNNLREKARRQLEVHMKTLEILAEVFVVFFVALPVFLLIMVSTAQFLEGGLEREFFAYMYFFIPVGGGILVYLVDLINIKEDLSITRVKMRGHHFSTSILSKRVKNYATDTGKQKRFSGFTAVRENYYNALFFSPLLLSATFLSARCIKFKFEESFIAVILLSLLLPLLVAFEYRARFVRRVEKEIPDLLRQILNLRDVGLTLQGVVKMLKESKLGVLSREIRLVDSDIEWGATVGEAFIELVNRVGVAEVRRAISSLVRASEVTESIRDVLLITIEDFEYGLKMKNMRFTVGFAYLVIVYISFFVLLYTAYTLEHSFLLNLSASGGRIEGLMYRTTLITALFSGVLAGQMEKGHILHGLKHVCVFAVASLLMFEFMI